MSNNKQSSVEYLIEQLLPKALSAEQFYHIQQAKAMHKEEHRKTFNQGLMSNFQNFEDYYNETFNTK